MTRRRVHSDIPNYVPIPKSRPSYNPLKHSLASLPYHILLIILTHAASTPGAPHDWVNTPFLLACATLCRTLHDPAIAVLYHNPPTHPPTRAHRLLATLQQRPELGQKVKRLAIEIDPLLTIKFGGNSWDVCQFLLLAKGLRGLQFAHAIDNPPYHEGPGMRLGWRYPDALWRVLEGKSLSTSDESLEPTPEEPPPDGIRLKSWKWNGKFLGKLSYTTMGHIHQSRAFSALTSISFIYIDPHHSDSESSIAHLITQLPSLHTLKFECSSIVTGTFLSLLASSPHLHLRELSLVNCPLLEASSDDDANLTTFLRSPPCCTLRVLEVLHSRSCSLSFTTALVSTPELEHLAFDGHLFNTSLYSRSANAEPEYDTLLPSTDTPVWPTTLQSIVATSLRKWSSLECIAFLSSLVEAAPEMRRLKTLEVRSTLADIDWRERAEFREKWIGVVAAAFRGAKVEVSFDNARPAEQLWKEVDFVVDAEGRGGRRAGRRRAVVGRKRRRGEDDDEFVGSGGESEWRRKRGRRRGEDSGSENGGGKTAVNGGKTVGGRRRKR